MVEVRAGVSVGDRVVVVKTDGELVAGRLQRFGEDDLELRIKRDVTERVKRGEAVILPRAAIQSFDRRRDSSKGTLIGTAVGGGIAVTLFAAAFANDANEPVCPSTQDWTV
jgi:hydrogenase maturation factor